MRADRSLPRLVFGRRLDLRRAVTNDFPLKAIAVVIALLFWLVAGQNTPPREVTAAFAGRIPVERPDVPTGYVLRGSLGDVGVTLRGPEGAVGRVAITDLRATVDVSAADLKRSAAQELPVRVPNPSDQVVVVDISPATIPVRIEPITARTIALQPRFANGPPAGTRAGDPEITPTEVRVTGPDSVVTQIAAVYATVLFGDATVDLVQSARPIAVDAAGAALEGLTLEPAVVHVSVPVLPLATTRTLPVLFSVRGAVAPGYWISRITVDPPAVTLRGASEVLAAIDRLETGVIDVSGLTADRTSRVPILIPAGTSMLRPVDATVTLTVTALSGTRPFPTVAVTAANLDPRLVAEVDPPTVSVVLAGPLPALAGLEGLIATVDAAGKGPGNYQVDVVVRAPPGDTVQTVQPTRATLTIRTRGV